MEHKPKHILVFVGMPGSGKGTCTEYLHERYKLPLIHFGTMVYEEVERRGLHNVEDEKLVREDMRAKEGMAVMAKHAVRKADRMIESGHDTIVFDGLYSWSEYKYLVEKYGDTITMIAVVAPKAVRRKRVLSRKDSHRTYTLPQLIDRELSEIENIEKGGPIAYADYYINNNGTLDEFIGQLELILDSVLTR